MKIKRTIGEKYYLLTSYFTIILFFIYIFGVNNSFYYSTVMDYKNISSDSFDGATYPIKYLVDPLILSYDERQKEYSTIESKNYISIPKYDPNIFSKDISLYEVGSEEYNNIIRQRLIYTTPYMGNYNFDYKEYVGSHVGVDISTSPGTPVYNIANGVVIKTGYNSGGFGNFILIRHDNVNLPNGTVGNIYSVYGHLTSIDIEQGQKISKGTQIGKVGKTGLATGNHLHFQIELDSAPSHPYWPFTNEDLKERNLDFFEGINKGLKAKEGIIYTINPLEFINNNISNINYALNIVENVIIEKENVVNEEITTEDKTEIKQENLSLDIQKLNIKKNEVEVLSAIKLEDFEEDKIVAYAGDDLDKALLDLGSQEKIINDIDDNKEEKELEEILDNTLENGIVEENKEEIKKEEIIENNQILTGTIFKDIKNDYKFLKELNYFIDKKILSGYEDNTFKPENNLSRIEMLKVLLLSFDKEPVLDKSSIFNDIKTKSWQNTYVNAGFNLGFITNQNNFFYPNREVSRIEFLKMLLIISNVNLDLKYKTDINFKDVAINDWSYKYIKYAYYKNLFDLKNDYFKPNKKISREEMIKIIYFILTNK